MDEWYFDAHIGISSDQSVHVRSYHSIVCSSCIKAIDFKICREEFEELKALHLTTTASFPKNNTMSEKLVKKLELIAVFDGWELQEDDDGVQCFVKHQHKRYHYQLIYNISWSLLMPIVERIEAMGHKTIIGGGDHWGNYCNIVYYNDPDKSTKAFGSAEGNKAVGQGKTKIEAVFNAVVEFIQWYNSTKK